MLFIGTGVSRLTGCWSWDQLARGLIQKCHELDVIDTRFDTLLQQDIEREKIPVVIEIAQSQGIRIKSISLRKPTLDDVFLYFTGRTMRDEEPEHRWKKYVRHQYLRGR